MNIYQCIKCGKICFSELDSDLHSSAFLGHGDWKVLQAIHLPLKKQWYEMIESGIKTEEYREIKPHWTRRFIGMNQPLFSFRYGYKQANVKGYTHVKFSYGYTKRIMTFEIKEITIGKGNPEWGAPKEDVFIIKLGERIC